MNDFIQDIALLIHDLSVLLMIVFIFLMYCDLLNYRSLLNSFNKYDFVC